MLVTCESDGLPIYRSVTRLGCCLLGGALHLWASYIFLADANSSGKNVVGWLASHLSFAC